MVTTSPVALCSPLTLNVVASKVIWGMTVATPGLFPSHDGLQWGHCPPVSSPTPPGEGMIHLIGGPGAGLPLLSGIPDLRGPCSQTLWGWRGWKGVCRVQLGSPASGHPGRPPHVAISNQMTSRSVDLAPVSQWMRSWWEKRYLVITNPHLSHHLLL